MPGLALEIVWFDDHIVELKINASNAKFSGQANFYAALNAPSDVANRIEGFPGAVGDVREYTFGDINLPGYASARIRFSCKDGSDHLTVLVAIHMNPIDKKNTVESVTIQLDTLPSSIGSFVNALRSMKVQVSEPAVLNHAA